MSGSGISWAICKSAPCSRQTTTPASHHSVFYRPDALPAGQTTASKHYKRIYCLVPVRMFLCAWNSWPFTQSTMSEPQPCCSRSPRSPLSRLGGTAVDNELVFTGPPITLNYRSPHRRHHNQHSTSNCLSVITGQFSRPNITWAPVFKSSQLPKIILGKW